MRLVPTLLLLALLASCGGGEPDLVLYVALDRNHSEPIVQAFEEDTGLDVEAYYDIEASKSVGHRKRLQEEANNPRCDVFWNNEAVQTVLLAEEGLLAPYRSPNAQDIPEELRDPGELWTGFAARARILIVNTDLLPDPADRPTGTASFTEERFAGQAGMARPLTGTTAAHAGVLIAKDGLEATLELFEAYRDNGVVFGPGNAQVMRLVRDGELAFGWTDTDDCKAALDGGYPVSMEVPDQGLGEMGLIVIPNTVSLVKGAPHEQAARRFIDYVLDPSVEERLAHGPSGQIPVRGDVPRPEGVLDLSGYELARIDWGAAGRAYADNTDALEAFFLD